MRAVPNILIVGAQDKVEILSGLSIRLFITDTAGQAMKCLKEKRVDALITRWDLSDLGDGELLRNVAASKPWMPTVALIKAGSYVQEVAARGIGVSAVLPEDIDDGLFLDTVCQLANTAGIFADGFEYAIEGVRYVVVKF